MSEAPIQIRKPEVARAIRRLAEKKGQAITEAVAEVVNAELSRLDDAWEADTQRRIARAQEIVARFRALPTLAPIPSDEDFYDEDGFPK